MDREFTANVEKYSLNRLKEMCKLDEAVVGIVKKYIPEDCLIIDLGNELQGRMSIQDFDTMENSVTGMVSKVGSKIYSYVDNIDEYDDSIILNRRRLHKDYIEKHLNNLPFGSIFETNVISVAPFGLFVDMGYGVIGLLPLNDISIARLDNLRKHFNVGDSLKVIYKGKGSSGYIVSHKELLGTWEENVADFTEGEVIQGIVRDIKPYGAFIEITPNLTGLADIPEGVELQVGDSITVIFKSSNVEKQKVKLAIVKKSSMPYEIKYNYKVTSGILKEWVYTPYGSKKEVKTIFDGKCER